MNTEIALTKVREELAAGNRINAIKEYQRAVRGGLKEAKEYVEAMPEYVAMQLKMERERSEDRANEREAAERKLITERRINLDLMAKLDAVPPSNLDIMNRLDGIDAQIVSLFNTIEPIDYHRMQKLERVLVAARQLGDRGDDPRQIALEDAIDGL